MNMYVRCCGADMNLPTFFLLHVIAFVIIRSFFRACEGKQTTAGSALSVNSECLLEIDWTDARRHFK